MVFDRRVLRRDVHRPVRASGTLVTSSRGMARRKEPKSTTSAGGKKPRSCVDTKNEDFEGKLLQTACGDGDHESSSFGDWDRLVWTKLPLTLDQTSQRAEV